MNFDLNILNNTIDDLKNNPNCCILSENKSEVENVFVVPESIPSEQLCIFFKYIYDNNKIDKNYMENMNKIENKQINEFTYEEVLTNLTFIDRRDRFCSGGLYSDVKSGLVLNLLLRLKELVDNKKDEDGGKNMNYVDEEKEIIINNEFDYSNIIASAENIGYLIQYCETIYNNFTKLIQDDEEKNEKLKEEFKNYNYKKSYSLGFEVIIRLKSHDSVRYKNCQSYMEAYKNGQVNNVNSLQIEMNLDYKRGASTSLREHENKFKISFKPYEIMFTRKSNHNEANMNSLENSINDILKKFPVVNTIFYKK